MEIILHRRNTIRLLQETPSHYGVEIDLRSYRKSLILHHDPFEEGEDFEEWLCHYQHGTLILNVKEEGLEDRIVLLMNTYAIKHYFFLDISFPFIIRKSNEGLQNIAIRYSEYESIETVLRIQNRVDWVWVDCFTHIPENIEDFRQFQKARLKVCLVSPELHGREGGEVENCRRHFMKNGITIDAVCTKRPELWQ